MTVSFLFCCCRLISSSISRAETGSKADVISSNNRIEEGFASVLASDSRCRCPPDKSLALLSNSSGGSPVREASSSGSTAGIGEAFGPDLDCHALSRRGRALIEMRGLPFASAH